MIPQRKQPGSNIPACPSSKLPRGGLKGIAKLRVWLSLIRDLGLKPVARFPITSCQPLPAPDRRKLTRMMTPTPS
eukprot:9556315-Alexandrium_andersonii.AAC.2